MATENFTTYTEVQGASATITEDANTITATAINNNEINYVYKDKTAAHTVNKSSSLSPVNCTKTSTVPY